MRAFALVSPPGLPVAGLSFHAGNLDFIGGFAMPMLLAEAVMASHICAVAVGQRRRYDF